MSKKLLIILCVLLFAPCVYAGSRPEGFTGIKWGSYFHEFRNMNLKEFGKSGDRFRVYTREDDNIALNNVRPTHVFYNFLDGMFSGVNMVFDIADKDKVINILTRQHGPCRKLNQYSYLWEFYDRELDEIFPFIIKAETLEIMDGSKVFNVQYSTPQESEYASEIQ